MRSNYTYYILESIPQFLSEYAEPWNELWEASMAYHAIAQAEPLNNWLTYFADGKRPACIVVMDGGDEMVGGMPVLIDTELGVSVARTLCNDWAYSGCLMIHPDADANSVCNELIDALMELRVGVLKFEHTMIDMPQWIAFRHALNQRGLPSNLSRVKKVGVVDIGNDWDSYWSCVSRNHRSAVKRSEKKARKEFDVRLERVSQTSESSLSRLLDVVFQIEHSGWKGREGSSILSHPDVDRYFREEARLLLQRGAMEVWTLMFDDQPVAFEYCQLSKHSCLSTKISYDESFQKFGPGRLLRKLQLEILTNEADGRTKVLDTMGTFCESKAKWGTRTYRTGSLTAAIHGRLSGLLVQGENMARKIKHQFRPPAISEVVPGAASFQQDTFVAPM